MKYGRKRAAQNRLLLIRVRPTASVFSLTLYPPHEEHRRIGKVSVAEDASAHRPVKAAVANAEARETADVPRRTLL